jgi:hypothetical protein
MRIKYQIKTKWREINFFKKTNLQKVKKKKNKIDKKNQKNEDQIWNENQIKSNDRDEIEKKKLQKLKKKIDANKKNKDHIV